MCCRDLIIRPEHLVFPERMSPEGQEFVRVRGLDKSSLGALRAFAEAMPDGQVKIRHRCQHLTAEGQCDIYSHRPSLCRSFDCATRHDCACHHG